MGDRYNIHSQLEHLQSKYIGTGHADITKFEWILNQHRDSYSSYLGHFDMSNFFAIVENETKARVKFNIMEKMIQPCGPPTEKPVDRSGSTMGYSCTVSIRSLLSHKILDNFTLRISCNCSVYIYIKEKIKR